MPKTRRKVDPADRLSDLQERILRWVYENQTVRGPQGYVPWRPSVFIGESPTQAQSNALSTSLKRLEERGLLHRYSITYKDDVMTGMVWGQVSLGRIRTSHVQLSREGFRLVESLVDKDFDLKEDEVKRERRKAQRQAEGLRFALDLINERIAQGMDDDAKRDASRARLAVVECLNQLADTERGKS